MCNLSSQRYTKGGLIPSSSTLDYFFEIPFLCMTLNPDVSARETKINRKAFSLVRASPIYDSCYSYFFFKMRYLKQQT